jgi:hypothetical protein
LNHHASPQFWALHEALPSDIRELADKNYKLLKSDPRHPSLHFKKIGDLWSVRIGLHYRALGMPVQDGIYWFWIGTHADYDKIVA